MEKEILVEVQNVSKKFTLDLKTSLKYGATDIIKSSLGFKTSKELRKGEFWAVQDISFKLRRGECIGLIGHNGAGKSTLLKVLNGLYAPDKGQITMRGKIGALIELGAGFNPILTGRENIYNNAAILGFTKEEVNQKIQSIIDFSEIEKFIDMPVQNYSSGMKVRLGFAVAAHLEPDVLIIDEVLAVGDLGFILKCFKKIDELLPNTAVIFVSHSMPMVSRICNEIILMDHGIAVYQGNNIGKGIDKYYEKFVTNDDSEVVFDSNSLRIVSAKILDKTLENSQYIVEWNSTFEVEISFENINLNKMPYIDFVFYDKEQRGIAETIPENQNLSIKIEPGEIITKTFLISNFIFSKGNYYVTVTFAETGASNMYLKQHKVLQIQVKDTEQIWTPILINSKLVN
ncbi:ABC transporter ATP-binding protein [Empedobacter falsenii]